MAIRPDGTDPTAPAPDGLRAAGIDREVIGDAGEVGYIHGAIHWVRKAAVAG